jgi:hypothetical protein
MRNVLVLEDFAVLEMRGGTHLAIRRDPEGPRQVPPAGHAVTHRTEMARMGPAVLTGLTTRPGRQIAPPPAGVFWHVLPAPSTVVSGHGIAESGAPGRIGSNCVPIETHRYVAKPLPFA